MALRQASVDHVLLAIIVLLGALLEFRVRLAATQTSCRARRAQHVRRDSSVCKERRATARRTVRQDITVLLARRLRPSILVLQEHSTVRAMRNKCRVVWHAVLECIVKALDCQHQQDFVLADTTARQELLYRVLRQAQLEVVVQVARFVLWGRQRRHLAHKECIAIKRVSRVHLARVLLAITALSMQFRIHHLTEQQATFVPAAITVQQRACRRRHALLGRFRILLAKWLSQTARVAHLGRIVLAVACLLSPDLVRLATIVPRVSQQAHHPPMCALSDTIVLLAPVCLLFVRTGRIKTQLARVFARCVLPDTSAITLCLYQT